MSNSAIDNFKNLGYAVAKSVISDELRDVVTQYALFDEMQDFSPGGQQVPAAHAKYADPIMESILIHLHEKMENYTGLKLYPTYSYYRVYRGGDELVVHKDRESCEISATLCFNYNYSDQQYQWPIFIGKEKSSVILNPGDMLIYKGCELSHWRDKFVVDENTWQVQGFFHYVDVNGPYADFKFDQRSSIGINNRQPASTSKSYIQYTK
jgi:hypothetical protein